MSILSRVSNIPVFTKVGENLLYDLDKIIKESSLFFCRPLILSGAGPTKQIGRKVTEALLDSTKEQCFATVPNNSVEVVEKVKTEIDKFKPDVLISVGGGKVLDVGKVASTEKMIGCITIPTAPSNDGIASPVAVINIAGQSRSIGVSTPIGVIVDLHIIRSAPLRTIRAGIGDLISNLSACCDWRLAYSRGLARFDCFAEILARTAAENLLHFGFHDILSLNFLQRLVEGLILSGIAMGIAGSSRPCSGAEHMISHALDQVLDKPALHGEQVALGMLIVDLMRNGNNNTTIKTFFQSVGLSVHYKDFGISREELIEAVILAPKTRGDRYSILNEIKNDRDNISIIIDQVFMNNPFSAAKDMKSIGMKDRKVK